MRDRAADRAEGRGDREGGWMDREGGRSGGRAGRAVGEQGDIDLASRGRIRGDGRAGGTEQGGQSRGKGGQRRGREGCTGAGGGQSRVKGWVEQCELE